MRNDVDPLPAVPPTWIVGTAKCGDLRSDRSDRMRSSEYVLPEEKCRSRYACAEVKDSIVE